MSATEKKVESKKKGGPSAQERSHASEIVRRLRSEYPDAHIVLDFDDDWQLLVAVILSAQTTDKTVNQVTASLFKKYPSIEDFAGADVAEFEADIHATGFFRNKTKHIIGAAQKVLSDYGGDVPKSMAELLTLPGVARKTANIVLGNSDPEAYANDPDAGIAVDTHVGRLSQRLGLATSKNPEKIERELMAVDPARRLVPSDLSPDRAWTGRLHGETAQVRRVRAAGYLSLGVQVLGRPAFACWSRPSASAPVFRPFSWPSGGNPAAGPAMTRLTLIARADTIAQAHSLRGSGRARRHLRKTIGCEGNADD